MSKMMQPENSTAIPSVAPKTTEPETHDKRAFSISNREKTYNVPLEEIIFISSKGMKITVYTTKGETYSCSKNIGYAQEKLKEEKIFCRPHTSYIINVLKVKEYNRLHGKIIMLCGTEIIPTRRRKSDFLEAFVNKLTTFQANTTAFQVDEITF